MPGLKVTDFDPAVALTGTEIFGFVQAGGNVQGPLTDIATFIGSSAITEEIIRDTVGATLVESTGINIVVDDAGNTITISVDITDLTESIQDIIGALISAATGVNSGIVVTYDDAGNAETVGLQSPVFQTLTDAATIAWNMANGFNAKVTLGGNRIIGTPTNPIEGRTYSLKIIQDGTGNRTITNWGVIDFGSAGNPTLSTAAGKIDMVYLQCLESAGPTFRATFNKSA